MRPNLCVAADLFDRIGGSYGCARLANDAALFGAVKPFYETGVDT